MAVDDRIDFDRVIFDPDYRRATIRRLNAAARAMPAQTADGETPAKPTLSGAANPAAGS